MTWCHEEAVGVRVHPERALMQMEKAFVHRPTRTGTYRRFGLPAARGFRRRIQFRLGSYCAEMPGITLNLLRRNRFYDTTTGRWRFRYRQFGGLVRPRIIPPIGQDIPRFVLSGLLFARPLFPRLSFARRLFYRYKRFYHLAWPNLRYRDRFAV